MTLLRRLLIVIFALALAAAVLFLAATSDQADVRRGEAVSQESVAEARQLWQRHDPRRLAAGEAVVSLPFHLIDDVLNYFATSRLRTRASLQIDDRSANARFSRPICTPIGRRYLNLRIDFTESAGLPEISSIRLGQLPIPLPLAHWALDQALDKQGMRVQWDTTLAALQHVEFDNQAQKVHVRFEWRPEYLTLAVNSAIPPAEVARLKATQGRFVDAMQRLRSGGAVQLRELLPELLFADDASPAQQRAALLVIGAHLADKSLAEIIPGENGWLAAPPLKIILHNRFDSAQHFVISAMISAWSDGNFADAIGLFKETLDKEQGSGFSFADLAADRAGTRFGNLVRREDGNLAQRLQGATITDDTLMPSPAGLPEFLNRADFAARFGDQNSPAYQQQISLIESRLQALPLYR